MNESLSKAKRILSEEKDHIKDLLNAAEECACRAVVHFELGQHEQARAQISKGCDLEFEALCDCEALGGLAQELYPGDDTL